MCEVPTDCEKYAKCDAKHDKNGGMQFRAHKKNEEQLYYYSGYTCNY